MRRPALSTTLLALVASAASAIRLNAAPIGGARPSVRTAARAFVPHMNEKPGMASLAVAFSSADVDGSMALSFEEFVAMQPEAMRAKYSAEELRAWFDKADADGILTTSAGCGPCADLARVLDRERHSGAQRIPEYLWHPARRCRLGDRSRSSLHQG
jgi:hypothetical protein